MNTCIKCKQKPTLYKKGKYANLCKECRRSQMYLDNRDSERASCQKWYAQNRESEIKKNSEYRKQNRELFNWYHDKDRFAGMRKFILEQDDSECQTCQSKENLIVHHIDGKGYTNVKKEEMNNDIKNLITLCKPCHSALHGWQKRNRKLKSREDIVRTLGKPKELVSRGRVRHRFSDE